MNVPPWVTYAAQLTPIGYGYPLWVPDPPPGRGAIQLGDVGWIHEGEFLPLFNALRAADDSQPRNAVPMNFIPLDIATLVFEGPREKIGQKVLCSSSILRRDFSGGIDLQVNVPGSLPYPSGSVELAFSCEDDSGALLMPHPCVVTHDIHSRRIMDQYMEVNFESWLEFAYNLGLDLREEDIRFVCGTKKTARWAVAAFQGNYRNKSGTLSGALGAVGSAHFSLSISNQALPANHYRVGPPGRTIVAGNHGTTSLPAAVRQYSQPWAEPYDQCVFINTLRRKKRRLPSFLRFLRAGAGPHSLPDNSGDPGEPGSSMCTTGRGTSSDGSSESYTYSDSTPFKRVPDALDVLLDYILENSEADVAIACEEDLVTHGLLIDLQRFGLECFGTVLECRAPEISIGGHGVGTVSYRTSSTESSTTSRTIDHTPSRENTRRASTAILRTRPALHEVDSNSAWSEFVLATLLDLDPVPQKAGLQPPHGVKDGSALSSDDGRNRHTPGHAEPTRSARETPAETTQGPDTGSKQRADERARHTPRGPGSKRALVTLACASDIPVWSCGSLKNILSSAPPPMLPRGDDACLNDTRRELSSEVSAMQTRTPINPGVMSPPPGEASTPPSRDKRRYASEEKEAIFWKRRKYEKLEGLYRCSWAECAEAYPTLEDLDTHITYMGHWERCQEGDDQKEPLRELMRLKEQYLEHESKLIQEIESKPAAPELGQGLWLTPKVEPKMEPKAEPEMVVKSNRRVPKVEPKIEQTDSIFLGK